MPVSPIFVTVSPLGTSELASPSQHLEWWCPAILRLSQGRREGEEHWQLIVFCSSFLSALPAPLMKNTFSAAWGLGESMTHVNAGSSRIWQPTKVALEGTLHHRARVSLLCAWKDHKGFLAKGPWIGSAAGEVSSSVCAYSGFPLLCRHSFVTLKSNLTYFADFIVPRQPYFSSFFLSLSHLFIACQYICCSPKIRSLERIKPGCLFPSFFSILHPLMFVILDSVFDGAASPYTVYYGAEALCSFWNQHYAVNGMKEDFKTDAVLWWLRVDFLMDLRGWVFWFFQFSFCNVTAQSVCCTVFPVGFFQC